MSWEVQIMKSKTSSFNLTIFRKSITRFWPLWGAYFALWLLILPISSASSLSYRLRYYDEYANTFYYEVERLLTSSQCLGIIVGAITAIVAVIALWGFMYSSRNTSGYSSLPVSRRSFFCSFTLAGLIPVLVINFVTTVILYFVMAAYGMGSFALAMKVFAITTLPYIFFFGFASFCAQLTGTIFVLVPLYALLNFVIFGAYIVIGSVLSQLVYGFAFWDSAIEWISYLSPPIGMGIGTNVSYAYETTIPVFHGWGCLTAYAVAGVAFALLAFFVFRRRRMESAGDVVAVNVLKPVFKYCMTFGCAIVLCAFLLFIFNDGRSSSAPLITIMLLLAIGAIIGYYIASMLIKKSFRVFKKHSLPGIGISLAILLVITAAVDFDIFGYEKYTPNVSKIEKIILNGYEIDEGELIEKVVDIHKAIIADKDRNELFSYRNSYLNYQSISYYLENGKTVTRTYMIKEPYDGGNTPEILNRIYGVLSSPTVILKNILPDFEITGPENIAQISITSEYIAEDINIGYDAPVESKRLYFTGDEAYELWNSCILPDIKDGRGIANSYYPYGENVERTSCYLYIDFVNLTNENAAVSSSNTIYVSTDAERTIAWLEAHDIPVYTESEIADANASYYNR